MTYASSSTPTPPEQQPEPNGPQVQDLLVLPPADGDDVCPLCRGVLLYPDEPTCENCRDAKQQLPHTCPWIIPISLYVKPSPLRDALTGYKDAALHPEDRNPHVQLLREIYARFVAASGDRLLESLRPDLTCIVPSTTREPPHPLGSIVSAATGMLGEPTDLLRRGPGKLGHRLMSEDAYEVTQPLEGRRVLLLDDVITTGCRIHSATTALANSGGVVTGALVMARRYNIDYHPAVRSVWDRQQGQPFDFAQACPSG